VDHETLAVMKIDPGKEEAELGLALEPAPPGLEAVLLQVSRAWC
jgi:hypothetical protein